MTGPDHYAEAERLIRVYEERVKAKAAWVISPPMLSAAQVHATLALAAATANSAGVYMSAENHKAWRAAFQESLPVSEERRRKAQ